MNRLFPAFPLCIAAFVIFFSAPAAPAHATTQEVTTLSLVNLIATPEKYDGKTVRVFGYLRLDFEGRAIYLHKEDHFNSLYKNGLWVNFRKGALKDEEMRALNGHHVMLEGTFDSTRNGHMDLWSGTIFNIGRAQKWGD